MGRCFLWVAYLFGAASEDPSLVAIMNECIERSFATHSKPEHRFLYNQGDKKYGRVAKIGIYLFLSPEVYKIGTTVRWMWTRVLCDISHKPLCKNIEKMNHT